MNWKTVALVGVFIVIFLTMLWRCNAHATEFVAYTGSSFGPSGSAPVLGFDARWPQGNVVDIIAGTTIWGPTAKADTNWDWHVGIRTCRGPFCASLGASYLQRIDDVNGSHTNYLLGLSYRFNWWRLDNVGFIHLSDLGTTPINKGRNAAVVGIRLQ
jgi:hypothetical protein